MVPLATRHYFRVQSALVSDSYQPEKPWTVVCSLVVVLIGAGVLCCGFNSALLFVRASGVASMARMRLSSRIMLGGIGGGTA
jgi:hypothetical protein